LIQIDALRFWLKHFFYLFARLLIVSDNDCAQL